MARALFGPLLLKNPEGSMTTCISWLGSESLSQRYEQSAQICVPQLELSPAGFCSRQMLTILENAGIQSLDLIFLSRLSDKEQLHQLFLEIL